MAGPKGNFQNAKKNQLVILATQEKKFFQLLYLLFVNWSGQMSAGQTRPKKSKKVKVVNF